MATTGGEDGIEMRCTLWYHPCEACRHMASLGIPYDNKLMILCNGVGHLMVAANRTLCEESPR